VEIAVDTPVSRRISVSMRQKLNLTLPEGMIEEMKIQAVREKRAVSEIVEELCRQYLGRQKKAKRKTKQAV
jgi:metal-responsive CopG/Arc/MetJ family transcriptional regulator